jgi:hypothetical protein
MASFTKGAGSLDTPFGRNEFLRSTDPKPQTESYTLAASTVPSKTIDGNAGQKILQPGTVLAKIATGPEAGKVGPFQAGATDGRAVTTNIVGLCLTFLPWQTIERDVEVSAVYTCTAVQGWCIELDAAGASLVLTNATADAMRGSKSLDILFH